MELNIKDLTVQQSPTLCIYQLSIVKYFWMNECDWNRLSTLVWHIFFSMTSFNCEFFHHSPLCLSASRVHKLSLKKDSINYWILRTVTRIQNPQKKYRLCVAEQNLNTNYLNCMYVKFNTDGKKCVWSIKPTTSWWTPWIVWFVYKSSAFLLCYLCWVVHWISAKYRKGKIIRQ